MSKKMLKRSLALGALMAFVITGQALAAKATLGQGDYVVDSEGQYIAHGISNYGNGIKNVSEWELGQYTLWVDQAAFQDNAIQLPQFNITGDSEGSTLLIKAGEGKSIKFGLGLTGNVDVDKVYIEVDEQAIKAEGGGGEISVTANEIILKVKDGAAVYAYKEGSKVGKVKITPKEKLEIYSDAEAVRANNGSSITIASPENQKADIIINGNVDTRSGATVDLKLETAASVLNGSVNAYEGDTVKYQGTRNITLSGGATWNVTAKSDVTTLAGDNANIVVQKLDEGLVTIVNDNTEQLTVSADAKLLTGNDVETNLKKVVKTIQITNDNDETGTNTAKITGDKIYDEISGNFDKKGEIVGTIDKTVAEANYSAKDMAALGLMSWRAEMNDMNKRMGELRNANGEHGVWVRMVRGEDEYKSVKSQYNQYQLGYDEKLSVDKRWTVGMALSYTDGETSFAKGSGENTNKALSIYGSKLNGDGTFVDLIAKYARLENDFKSYSGMEDADYSTNGYSVSAEFGKRIQQGKGLWIEPQVELTYGKVSAVDYLSKAGVKVAQDGMESLIGRVGFSLGKDIKQGNVYARASYLYDFDGETAVTLDGQEKLEQDLGGGWWEVGVGANINLSKATYIYADVEKTFGGEVDTNWQWNLGVRYSF